MEKERFYEILYLLPGDISKDQISSISSQVEEIIKKYNGKIIYTSNPEYKDLAYKIKNFRTGYYILTIFKALSEDLPKINRDLKYLNDILRYMISLTIIQDEDELNKKYKQEEVKEEIKEAKEERKIPEKVQAKKEEVDLKNIDKKIDEILKEEINTNL